VEEEEEKGRKAKGSGRDHRHPPPFLASPPLPPSGIPVDSRPPPPIPPARRRGAPGRADLLRRPARLLRCASACLRAVSVAAASPHPRARFLVGWDGNGPGAGSPLGTRRCRWLLDLGRAARPPPRSCRRSGPRRSSSSTPFLAAGAVSNSVLPGLVLSFELLGLSVVSECPDSCSELGPEA